MQLESEEWDLKMLVNKEKNHNMFMEQLCSFPT